MIMLFIGLRIRLTRVKLQNLFKSQLTIYQCIISGTRLNRSFETFQNQYEALDLPCHRMFASTIDHNTFFKVMRFLINLSVILLSLFPIQDDKLLYSVEDEVFTPLERIQQAKVPGMSIHLITNFNEITELNYGVTDYQSNNLVTATTLYQAGGLTNTVTNVVAMIAVQEGKLDLRKNVNDYLTTWKIPQNKYQKNNPVTLEDLLLKRRGFKQQGKPYGYSTGETIPSLLEIMNGTGNANTAPIQLRSGTTSRGNYSFETEMVVQVLLQEVYDMAYSDIVI